MITNRDIQNRADRLAVNPHNLPGIAGSPPMTNHAYWAARFELEGMTASASDDCPYRAGTMAATRWQSGRDWQAAMLASLNGETTSAI